MLTLLLLAFAIVAASLPARAHLAAAGWQYDADCCGARDCRVIGDDAVRLTRDGLLIVATGEVLSYADTRLRKSGDEFFHRCARETSPKMTVCLYIPATA